MSEELSMLSSNLLSIPEEQLRNLHNTTHFLLACSKIDQDFPHDPKVVEEAHLEIIKAMLDRGIMHVSLTDTDKEAIKRLDNEHLYKYLSLSIDAPDTYGVVYPIALEKGVVIEEPLENNIYVSVSKSEDHVSGVPVVIVKKSSILSAYISSGFFPRDEHLAIHLSELSNVPGDFIIDGELFLNSLEESKVYLQNREVDPEKMSRAILYVTGVQWLDGDALLKSETQVNVSFAEKFVETDHVKFGPVPVDISKSEEDEQSNTFTGVAENNNSDTILQPVEVATEEILKSRVPGNPLSHDYYYSPAQLHKSNTLYGMVELVWKDTGVEAELTFQLPDSESVRWKLIGTQDKIVRGLAGVKKSEQTQNLIAVPLSDNKLIENSLSRTNTYGISDLISSIQIAKGISPMSLTEAERVKAVVETMRLNPLSVEQVIELSKNSDVLMRTGQFKAFPGLSYLNDSEEEVHIIEIFTWKSGVQSGSLHEYFIDGTVLSGKYMFNSVENALGTIWLFHKPDDQLALNPAESGDQGAFWPLEPTRLPFKLSTSSLDFDSRNVLKMSRDTNMAVDDVLELSSSQFVILRDAFNLTEDELTEENDTDQENNSPEETVIEDIPQEETDNSEENIDLSPE